MMRISMLSARCGMSVPTIKFYIREGLLPAGKATARNQAEYDDSHLERLHLIRILTTVGQLGLAAARDVLRSVDNPALSRAQLYWEVNGVLFAERVERQLEEDVDAIGKRVNDCLDALQWRIDPSSPARETLAQVLAFFCRFGWDGDTDILGPYIEVARQLAAHELAIVAAAEDTGVAPAVTAVHTVLFDVLMTTMRRLTQEAQDRVAGPASVPRCRRSGPAEAGADRLPSNLRPTNVRRAEHSGMKVIGS